MAEATGSAEAAGSPATELTREEVVWALVDAVPDGLVMADEHGVILLVNRQAEQQFGYPRDELVGQPVELLLPEGLGQSHTAHRTRYRSDPRVRPMGAGLELFGRRRDGAEFPVEISLSPFSAEGGLRVIATIRDISGRQLAEAYAREIQRVLDGSSDAVLMFDRDTLRFTYVNQGAIAQLGYTRDELLSMTPLHIKPDLTEADYRRLIVGLSPGESYTYMTVHRRKDGVDVPVEALLQRPPEGRGESEWMVSTARDQTERLEVERRAQVAEQGVAVLEDRQRIARDLHDRVIQRIFASGLGLDAIRGRVTDPVVAERLGEIVDELDDTIHQLRSSIFHLNNPATSGSLRTQAIGVSEEGRLALGFDPSVRFHGPVEVIGADIQAELLAVLREALSNVAHHARARAVRVSIRADREVVLRVEDDGVGIPLAGARRNGNGLDNMSVRAARLGGTCTIGPALPSGTVVEWRVPLA